MGSGLPGVQHETALEPLDCLKGGEVGSERSANGLSREADSLAADNGADRAQNAPPRALAGRLGCRLSPTGS